MIPCLSAHFRFRLRSQRLIRIESFPAGDQTPMHIGPIAGRRGKLQGGVPPCTLSHKQGFPPYANVSPVSPERWQSTGKTGRKIFVEPFVKINI